MSTVIASMRTGPGEGRAGAGEFSSRAVLSICCLYPNPAEPGQGLFVQRRLRHLAELTNVRVIAPVALIRYGNPKGHRTRIHKIGCPRRRLDGNMEVLHPRWFYPPLSGSLTPLWLSLRLIPTLVRLRKEFPFEIIDTHFGYPEGIAGAVLSAVFRVPFTMTLRGNEPKHSRGTLERSVMGWALRRASRVFTVSERLRHFAMELRAEPAKVKTIPNGVDATVFTPHDRRECRLRYGLPLDRPLVVSAGALVERKGHHRIIQALRDLRFEGSAAELVIAGGPGPEGQYEHKLRSLVAGLALGHAVHFLGPLPAEQLAEVISAANVFCLASTNEGWPNVVHEALACGTPVVATDVGAVPEMLPGERYGIIVPVNDGAMLRSAIAKALSLDWDRSAIADWGRSRSWSKVAIEVMEELQATLRK